MTISNLFDLRTVQVAAFASVLEGLAVGVVLVDESLAIVHANSAADAMLVAGRPIQSRSGALTLSFRDAQEALERAVHRSATDLSRLGPRGIGIPATADEADPAVIHVMPLRQIGHRRSVAALFVTRSLSAPSMPRDALAMIYDLTPAEIRIFELICSGRNQARIAETLGIATSTVKTHLRRLFEKTGCDRQTDLVRLAASLSLPL